MTMGCIIRDEAGNVVMDNSTRIARILGVGNTGTADGTISPAGADTGTLFVLPLIGIEIVTASSIPDYPTFSTSAGTISWTFNGSSGPTAIDFLFGVR